MWWLFHWPHVVCSPLKRVNPSLQGNGDGPNGQYTVWAWEGWPLFQGACACFRKGWPMQRLCMHWHPVIVSQLWMVRVTWVKRKGLAQYLQLTALRLMTNQCKAQLCRTKHHTHLTQMPTDTLTPMNTSVIHRRLHTHIYISRHIHSRTCQENPLTPRHPWS